MGKKEYIRKQKENQPVLAICYDFDKTLTPDNMQAQGYIQSVGYDRTDEFWKKSNALAEENEMDQNLAYMYQMMLEADGRIVFNKEKLREYGSKIKLYPGVEEWFERIRGYGKDHGVIVEHYIISSGLKEMIEGTSVAKAGAFEKIYASSFYYENGRSAKWPAQAINYTNKTQFLFRIEKGVLDVNDPGVNDYFPPEEIRVPFRNMVYIGDSDTDVPCMKLINSYGGHAIGVYNPDTKEKDKVYKMMREDRIKYFAPSDYSEGTELDMLIKAIIDKTAAAETLERISEKNKKEQVDTDNQSSQEDREKRNLINELEDSYNFAKTHLVVAKLSKIDNWDRDQAERLYKAALNNSQVLNILADNDLTKFYTFLLGKHKKHSKNAKMIKDIIGYVDTKEPPHDQL